MRRSTGRIFGRKRRVAVLAATMVCASGIAGAADFTSPASGTCWVADPDPTDNVGFGSHALSGRVINANTDGSVVQLECAITRHNTTNTTGLANAKAYLHRGTSDPNNPISCNIYSSRNVSSGVIIAQDHDHIDGTGELVIEFGPTSVWDTPGSPSSLETTGNDASFYQMFCELPKNGDIMYGYWWSEF